MGDARKFLGLKSHVRSKNTVYFYDKDSPLSPGSPLPSATPTPTPTPIPLYMSFTIDTTLGTPNDTYTSPNIRAYSGITFTDLDTTNYQYTIKWGDGNQDTLYYVSASSFISLTTHTYSSPGTYNITIEVPYGQVFHYIGFYTPGNDTNLKITSVDDWGNQFEVSGFGRLDDAFFNCSNLVSVSNNLNTTNMVDTGDGGLAEVFLGTTSFTGDVTNMVVSGLTTLNSTFRDSSFNQDISSWDVSNITSISSLFRDNTTFNQDLSSWDTSSVTTFFNMFNGATSFNQSLASWDITSVLPFQAYPTTQLSMVGMLDDCGMSTTNYDATLIGWAAQSVQSGVTLGANNLTYTLGGAAEAARTTLTTTYGWNIVGDSGI